MTHTKALKLALEALELALEALELALEALEEALEALEEAWYHVGTFQPTEKAIDLYDEARTAIKAALAQPAQEPVAVWELQEDGWDTICDGDWLKTLPVGTKLYTTPPQREWVGLTDEEILALVKTAPALDTAEAEWLHVVRAAEQSLKEKNT